ncbi:two component transcriptional regulator, LuxR family [Beutenbergia cavernae DSM 12333]|uniref:Two component transcriptional regulator, LuxR family n=1 Tax=Beutenbergia cavernae (strain ATCC BAA-8 / DSM 12333 / CCUG 43141 / JCM 11478 / NBRC 16432 / NCIMB 13614 / HKI 0122) TaxID=471853 RepID=C5BWN3_BEUC1|nr:response regulator transcription factor [Beutenbergia cavernae]ACQ80699.1 two component transcriptional regulator, LuxR family [Beutenbergia cavernae DSM 12333]
MIRVVVADDQALIRAGLRMILENADDMELVGEADDGAAAADLAIGTRPDVVLMDVRMPGVDGLEATRRIRAALPDGPRILVLTTFDLDEYVYAALRAGAGGFLLKDALATDLLSAIRVVAAGDAIVAPPITRRLIERHIGSPHDPLPRTEAELRVLTSREREVLSLIARGLSNAEIAGRLFVTEGTVKGHVSAILAKLGLRDRVQAVIFSYECGLVRTGA